MFPWLSRDWHLAAYGLCVVLAIVAAWLWARRRARAAGILQSHIDLLIPVVVATGIFGAWLFGRWTDVLTGVHAQATVLIGSLLVGMGAGIVYAWRARILLGVLGDIVAPPMALAIGMGRLGCFFAGCCFGKVCEVPAIGVRFPAESPAWRTHADTGLLQYGAEWSLPVFPVQLYEAALCSLLALILWRLRVRVSGEKFLWFGGGYAVIRFVLEFLRADNPPILASLTFSQVACVVILIAAIVTALVRRRHAKKWGLLLSPKATAAGPNLSPGSLPET